MTAPVPIVRQAGEGDRQGFLGGGLHTWKLLAEDTAGTLFLFEDAMGHGKTTPMHRHPEADEMTYVLDGEIVVNVDGAETRLSVGGMSYVPRGIPHAFIVMSDTARLLTMQSPGIGQGFYRDASDATDADSADTVDIPRVQASAQRNPRGMELLGPPPFASPASPPA